MVREMNFTNQKEAPSSVEIGERLNEAFYIYIGEEFLSSFQSATKIHEGHR